MSDPCLTLAPLLKITPLPIAGLAFAEPHRVWRRLVGQICAVGSSRSWNALEARGLWEALSPQNIRSQPRVEAVTAVHARLAAVGVRYCSPGSSTSVKARAIVENAHHPLFASGGAAFLEALKEEVGAADARGMFGRGQALAARRLLVRSLRFVGPKSASDFLLGLGLADSLLAFDVRVLNLLVDNLSWDPGIRGRVHSIGRYETLEADILARLAGPLGWTGVELDRVMFHHYAYLRRAWGQGERAIRPPEQAGVFGAGVERTVYWAIVPLPTKPHRRVAARRPPERNPGDDSG